MHKMNIENVFGTKLNLCKSCGAHLDKKAIWHLGGYESPIEPPCFEDTNFIRWQIKFTDWKNREAKKKPLPIIPPNSME